MLEKSPCEVSYADFTYRIEPIAVEAEDRSYIAARLITEDGVLWEPAHEYALTRNLAHKDAAGHAWDVGFDTTGSFFVPRQIVERLVAEGMAEEVQPPAKVYAQEPALAG